MGAVYRAWDTRLNIPVAVKELVPQPGLDASTLERLREQFIQEAQILARLDHPHLVNVSDYFEEREKAYLVMKYVAGESLAERIAREGALEEAQVLTWSQQLLSALAYCHGQQVLHRDLKPHNIVITPEGGVVLVDFGLVKLWDPQDPHTRTAIRGAGTPEYAPPEQYDTVAGHTDTRSDLYSLGATLYHALTGQAPPTATQRMTDPERFASPRAINREVSAGTEAAILRAMTIARAERFQSAEEMAAALRSQTPRITAGSAPQPMSERTHKLSSVQPPAPSRAGGKRIPAWGWALAAVGLVVLLVLGLGGLSRGRTPSPPMVAERTATPTSQSVAVADPTATRKPAATAAPEPTATSTPILYTAGDRRTREQDGMVMVYVPAGEFQMGSEVGYPNEKPVHTVALDAFWVDRTEVTNAQYVQCVEAGACAAASPWCVDSAPYQDPTQPVICIDWPQAAAYCEWAGSRLPTEAEWEYAALGPEGPLWPWGNQLPTCELANYGDCVGQPAPVGSYPGGASWVGALDMYGNVWEWVADWYGEYPASRQVNPRGPARGETRVARGGAYGWSAEEIGSTNRWGIPWRQLETRGFRCAQTSPPAP